MQLKLSTFFSRQPGPAPAVAQPKARPKAWACGQCTYVNGPDEARCEMCSAPFAASAIDGPMSKPAAAKRARAEPAEPSAAAKRPAREPAEAAAAPATATAAAAAPEAREDEPDDDGGLPSFSDDDGGWEAARRPTKILSLIHI